jgi:hypothetical protein
MAMRLLEPGGAAFKCKRVPSGNGTDGDEGEE